MTTGTNANDKAAAGDRGEETATGKRTAVIMGDEEQRHLGGKANDDGAFGHYLNISSCEPSPDWQLSQLRRVNNNNSNSNDNSNDNNKNNASHFVGLLNHSRQQERQQRRQQQQQRHPKASEDWNNDHTLQTNNVQSNKPSVDLSNLFEKPPAQSLGTAFSTPDLEHLRRQEEHEHEHYEGYSALSIPTLTTENDRDNENQKNGGPPPGTTANVSFRRSSFLSAMSWDTDADRNSTSNNDETSYEDIASLDSPPEQRSFQTLPLDSNRRISLTVDLATGKSPGTGAYHRGHQALRRSFSTDMMNAQSPRERRRRAMSQNMEHLRKEAKKIKKMLALPPGKHSTSTDADKNDASLSSSVLEGRPDNENEYSNANANDDVEQKPDLEEGTASQEQQEMSMKSSGLKVSFAESNTKGESIKFINRQRHRRYSVEQKNVKVLDGRRKQRHEVQYRLSTLTPVEIRRRNLRNNLVGNTAAIVVNDTFKRFNNRNGTHGGNNNNNNNNKNKNCNAISRCRRWFRKLRVCLAEIAITTTTQGKKHSVGVISKLLNWTYRHNLVVVFLFAALNYYLNILGFAVLLYLSGRLHPECIHVNGLHFHETDNRFVDAFALSWTTFTTVGYGLVYPGTSATFPEGFNIIRECTGMTIVVTTEAFVGILFSAFWGAVLFAKITRVSSFAQISFSNVAVIKFGVGVTGGNDHEEYASSDDDDPSFEHSYNVSKLPCPIFEFRIANRLNNQRGGEIIDAAINIVASMEESQASKASLAHMEGKKRRRKGGRRQTSRSSRSSVDTSGTGNTASACKEAKQGIIHDAVFAAKNMIVAHLQEMGNEQNDDHTTDDDYDDYDDIHQNSGEMDTTSIRIAKLFPNQVFAKLMVETMEHPFFNRVWNVRHVLDESSPILKEEAKNLIRINEGHWPEELNSSVGVRASIHFDQILVSFSGTSNVDANSVYSQHAYTADNVCVGYAFCNMLFRESDGSIGVDQKLLNDVKEQNGGGGERMDFVEAVRKHRSFKDIFIL
eukprot:jgi/Psemu1/324552/estExt_fgenesh1_pg.C_1560005